jgi:hypothetical protein
LSALQHFSISVRHLYAAADRSSLESVSQENFPVAIHSLAEMLTSRLVNPGGVLTG